MVCDRAFDGGSGGVFGYIQVNVCFFGDVGEFLETFVEVAVEPGGVVGEVLFGVISAFQDGQFVVFYQGGGALLYFCN